MRSFLLIALAIALGGLVIAGRVALHERDKRIAAEARAAGIERESSADDAALRELNSGADERERVYVEVVRDVTAAGPLSQQCETDPAWLAAGAGTLRLRDAYCRSHPARCPAQEVPDSGNGTP